MAIRKNEEIAFELIDWQGVVVCVPWSVLRVHLPRCHPGDANLYVETLKARFRDPDTIFKRTKRNELEFVINLEGREHKYLVVYVKYQTAFGRLFKKINYVATAYGTNQTRTGEILWQRQPK